MVTPTPSAPSASRRRSTRAILLLGLILLISGIAIGGGGVALLLPPPEPPPAPPSFDAEHLARRMAKLCALDAEQTEQMKLVLAGHMDELRTIRQDTARRVAAVHEKIQQETRQILTDEQFQKWNQHLEKVRQRHGMRRPLGSRERRRRPSPERMFQYLDRNRDGKLTEDEMPGPAWNRIQRADADGDGRVTPDELRAHRSRETTPPATETQP
jgi:hypothetical protein